MHTRQAKQGKKNQEFRFHKRGFFKVLPKVGLFIYAHSPQAQICDKCEGFVTNKKKTPSILVFFFLLQTKKADRIGFFSQVKHELF